MPWTGRPVLAAVLCVVAITIVGHVVDSRPWPSDVRHAVAVTALFVGLRFVVGRNRRDSI